MTAIANRNKQLYPNAKHQTKLMTFIWHLSSTIVADRNARSPKSGNEANDKPKFM